MPGLIEFWHDFMPRLFRKREYAPVDSVDALCDFVATRSAFIAQKSLYGYLKTRIGIEFPQLFEDNRFAESINIAKMNIYEACLSDLAVFASAIALDGKDFGDEDRRELAYRCHERGLADIKDIKVDNFSPMSARQSFLARLGVTDWHGNAKKMEGFTKSPDALVRWAPIVKEHKDLDEKFVRNSIRFAWIDIRRRLKKKLVKNAMAGEVKAWGDARGKQGDVSDP